MKDCKEYYFKNASEWRKWLHENHKIEKGVQLLLFKVNSPYESMRWEEAVQVALCYGWIDSTTRKIDEHSRKQYFCPRKKKSVWSKVNKNYIDQLLKNNLMHQSGLEKIAEAKENGSWASLDAVEELIIPSDLLLAFHQNQRAFDNYNQFSPSYKKSYLYWLNQAKREETRKNRIAAILTLCEQNKKNRE